MFASFKDAVKRPPLMPYYKYIILLLLKSEVDETCGAQNTICAPQ